MAAGTCAKHLARRISTIKSCRWRRSDMPHILHAVAASVAERRQILLGRHLSIVVLPDAVGRVRCIGSGQSLAPVASVVTTLRSVFEGRI